MKREEAAHLGNVDLDRVRLDVGRPAMVTPDHVSAKARSRELDVAPDIGFRFLVLVSLDQRFPNIPRRIDTSLRIAIPEMVSNVRKWLHSDKGS